MLRYIILAGLIIGLATVISAQMVDELEVKESTDKYDLGLSRRPSFPLIDLSRLKMSHAYGITFFSGSDYSGSYALYSNTISYQLARPLTLTLNLNILHDPGALWNDRSFSENARFLPSGWLDWRPSDSFRMSIGFETRPVYYDVYNYYNPGRYWFWHR